MDNLEAITAWREKLSDDQQMQFNHPATVLRHWKKAREDAEFGVTRHDRPQRTTARILKDEVKRLEDQNDEKDEKIARLQKQIDDRVHFDTEDVRITPDTNNFERVVRDMIDRLGEDGTQRIAATCLEYLPEDRAIETATAALKGLGYTVKLSRSSAASALYAAKVRHGDEDKPIVRKRLSPDA
jgi:hypothetical protein